MQSFKTFLLAGTVAAALAVSGTAQALTYTQTTTFGPGPTDYSSATGSPDSFYYFDTNGGTLTSITFSTTYGFTSSITVSNQAAGSSSGNVRTQSGAQFAASTSALTSVLNSRVNTLVDPVDGNTVSFGGSSLTPIAYDLRGTNPSYSLAPGGATNLTSTGGGATGPIVSTTAAELAAFSAAGGGTYMPMFSTLSGLILSNSGGNTTAQQSTTATATLTITYTYDAPVSPPSVPVPEPASIALIGAGLLGLGLIRRKA